MIRRCEPSKCGLARHSPARRRRSQAQRGTGKSPVCGLWIIPDRQCAWEGDNQLDSIVTDRSGSAYNMNMSLLSWVSKVLKTLNRVRGLLVVALGCLLSANGFGQLVYLTDTRSVSG